MEFFILLTTDNPRIFLDTLGDRVAAMLNYNIVQVLIELKNLKNCLLFFLVMRTKMF